MTNDIRKITVFCGSNSGASPNFSHTAVQLAKAMAIRGVSLVYGGADVGLMGVIAEEMLAQNREVIGVIPKNIIEMEIAKHNLSKIYIVDTMAERKSILMDLADAIIMLPGGFGSLDEFFEALVGGQLGFHHKPCGILNSQGYYDKLLEFLDHAVEQRFMKQAHRDMIIVSDDPETLLEKMYHYKPGFQGKWANTNAKEEEFSLETQPS